MDVLKGWNSVSTYVQDVFEKRSSASNLHNAECQQDIHANIGYKIPDTKTRYEFLSKNSTFHSNRKNCSDNTISN